jgi:hypothetical protein
LLALGGLGAIGAVGGWSLLRRRGEERPAAPLGPKLLVREQAACTAVPQDEQERRLADGAWLALATLPPGKRRQLAQEIEEMAASLEARANPLVVDVVEADPDSVLRRLSPWLLPVANAAQALMAGHWRSTDGALCVDVISGNEAVQRASEGHLVDPWDDTARDAGPARRARFLAWPVAHARRIALADAAVTQRAVARLRSRVVVRDSTLAVVVDASLQRGFGAFDEADRLRNACGRCTKALRRARVREGGRLRAAVALLRGASQDPSDRPPVGWLPLEQTQVLVVPRLSALARRDAFEAEIAGVVG